MRIDNNNQTNFGIKLIPLGVKSESLNSLVSKIIPEALNIGDPASVAFIEESSSEVAVRVARRTGEKSSVSGLAQGELGFRRGKNLLNLLRTANRKMNDAFVGGKNQTYSIGSKEDLEFLVGDHVLNVILPRILGGFNSCVNTIIDGLAKTLNIDPKKL